MIKQEKEITHHDKGLNMLASVARRFSHGTPDPQIKLRENFIMPSDQIKFEIMYLHQQLGNRRCEVILFQDGTWRLVVD